MKITFDDNDLIKEVLAQIKARSGQIKAGLQNRVDALISNNETYKSLENGELKELLLVDSPVFIKTWLINQIEVLPDDVTLFNFLDESFPKLLYSAEASYVTLNGKVVPWLEHLLYKGNIAVFRKAKLINTGAGKLLISDSNDLKIPPQDVGVQSNNFILRAMAPLKDNLGGLI